MCDYPDNVPYCDKQTESVVGFKCPAAHELPPNAVARRFLPFPRFPKPGDETAYIVVSLLFISSTMNQSNSHVITFSVLRAVPVSTTVVTTVCLTVRL